MNRTFTLDDVFRTPGGELPRRDFMKVATLAAAAVGLSSSAAAKVAEAAAAGKKPSVVWLHFQECTGCTESLLRTANPDLAEVILDLVSIDYHETLMAAAGYQAEQALHDTIEANAGKFICVVEGAIPTAMDGKYCMIAGKTAIDMLKEVADKAAAVIAIGSCASWGGIPSADPNPTGAVGVNKIVTNKPVVTLPGCPANPYIFLGTALQFATFGTLPALDDQGRPLHAYARVIHEDCPRRPHFDAGRFAQQYGDDGHKNGYCLYKLGCKGPQTHASCSLLKFGETDSWPIGIGHPCFGCTEQKIGFRVAMHDTVEILRPTPPDTYPAVDQDHRKISPVATGVAGLVAGAIAGAGFMASKKLSDSDEPEK